MKKTGEMVKDNIFNWGILLLVVLTLSTGNVLAQNVEVDLSAAGYEISLQDERDLGLSKPQSQNIESLDREYLVGKGKLQDQIRTKREVLNQELSLENPDRAKLQSLANEILAIQGKIVENHIDYIFKIREELTPEQRQKLHTMREEFKAQLKARADAAALARPEKKKENKSLPFSPPAKDSSSPADKKE